MSALIAHIVEISKADPALITPDTDLIETGIIDSFSIALLLLFIEDRLHINIELDEAQLDVIRTVRRMSLAFNHSEAQ
jgi:acyl carrier protein